MAESPEQATPRQLESYMEERLPVIEQRLERYVKILTSDELLDKLKTVGGYPQNITREAIDEPVKIAVLRTGGKRVRPFLVYLSHDLVRDGRKPYKFVDDLAAPMDLVHKGTCVIDDIEDKSEERNGLQTLHISHGRDVAINVGNLLYFAYEYFFDYPELFLSNGNGTKIGKDKEHEIRKAVSQELRRAHYGQGVDIQWSKIKLKDLLAGDRQPSEENYSQMARDKSTFPLATRIGAILGGANPQQKATLIKVGEYAGLAFQIKDDLLDLKPGTTNYGGDIQERKVTLPIVKVFARGDEHSNSLRNLLTSRMIPMLPWRNLIDEVVEIMNNCGAIQDSEKVAREYADKAINLLREQFQKESKPRITLEELIDYGVTRTK